jgi:hypothetical protein
MRLQLKITNYEINYLRVRIKQMLGRTARDRNRTVRQNLDAPSLIPLAVSRIKASEIMPQDLPDALRGEQWAFVQIPLEEVVAEATAAARGGFGDQFDVSKIAKDLKPDSLIPGAQNVNISPKTRTLKTIRDRILLVQRREIRRDSGKYRVMCSLQIA